MNLESKLQQLKNSPEGGLARPDFVVALRSVILRKDLTNDSRPLPVFRLQEGLLVARQLLGLAMQGRFAYIAAVFALIISATAAGAMSRHALPGDSLYSAKIALEKTQVRFTSNPASRAKIQMELAGRRLAEAEAVSSSPQAAQDALQRFSQDIRVAKETLKQAADPAQRESAAEVITQKARQYEEKLVEVKMNPRRTVSVAASEAIEDAEKALAEVKGIETEDSLKEEPAPAKEEAETGADSQPELKNGEVGI